MNPGDISILFAHTNPTFLMYVGILVQRLGYKVLLARDGVEAVSLAKEARPAVMLMQYEMPKLNGLSCLSMIRKDPQLGALPVLILDEGMTAGTRSEFAQLGASGFLSMPLNISEFYLAVQQSLSHSVKRRYFRAPVKLKVTVECGGDQRELFATNVSAEGMFLRTIDPFLVGSRMTLTFTVDDEDPIQVTGEVVSVSGLANQLEKEPGMGIRFVEIPEDSKYRLSYCLLKEITKDFDTDQAGMIGIHDSLI